MRFIEALLRLKLEEAKLKWKEKRENGWIWVTDVIHCYHRYELSSMFPEIAIAQFSAPQFIIGDLIHKAIQNLPCFERWEAEREVEVHYGEFKLKGRIDLYNEEEKHLIEIKSGRDVKAPPSPHHVLQVWIYKQMVGSTKESIVYITNGRIIQCDLRPEDYKFVLGKFKIRRITNVPQQSPLFDYISWWWNESPTPIWPWECDYCPYAHICMHRKSNSKR